jgi:hypothetical protein
MRAAQGEGCKRGREALPSCSQPRVALEVGVILFRPLSVVLAPRAEVATPALAVVVLIVDVEVVPCQASFIPALSLLFDPTAAHEGRLWIVARARVFTCGRGCDNDFQRRQQPCQFRKLSRANWHTSRPR